MTQPAIRVEQLSKRYHIGAKQEYYTFRDLVTGLVRTPLRRLRRFGRSSHHERDTVWALKDVSFEVEPGEVVGIIGRNGSGKSTLLKILSGITEPTAGRAEIRGRVGSLLEVGTGFHPELTGRENIFLSGAILGMKRQEIRQQFDAIVDFSGIEEFLDTPVKRYSSGMRVRLGFAVAAHLQPEILLVDEVLAVGDAEFQKKCLGKMGDVARGGRTILFVSHNMAAIRNLCEQAVLLDQGSIATHGPAGTAIETYLASGTATITGGQVTPAMHSIYPPDLEVFGLSLLDHEDNPTDRLPMGQPIRIRLQYRVRQPRPDYVIGVELLTGDGLLLAVLSTQDGQRGLPTDPEQDHSIVLEANIPLNAQTYRLAVKVKASQSLVDHLADVTFQVLPTSVGRSLLPRSGLLRVETNWQEAARKASNGH